MKERAKQGNCPRDRGSGSANILEVSRVGSHEVSEALVSKRATREAEREEMGYGVSHRGGAEREKRKTPRKHQDQARGAGDEPAVGGIVPSDVATAVTARGGTTGQRKKSIRTERDVHCRCCSGWPGLLLAPPSPRRRTLSSD